MTPAAQIAKAMMTVKKRNSIVRKGCFFFRSVLLAALVFSVIPSSQPSITVILYNPLPVRIPWDLLNYILPASHTQRVFIDMILDILQHCRKPAVTLDDRKIPDSTLMDTKCLNSQYLIITYRRSQFNTQIGYIKGKSHIKGNFYYF